MNSFKGKYLVDENGHKVAVMMDTKGYEKLINYVQDLEDSLELKHAIKHEKEKGVSLSRYLSKSK